MVIKKTLWWTSEICEMSLFFPVYLSLVPPLCFICLITGYMSRATRKLKDLWHIEKPKVSPSCNPTVLTPLRYSYQKMTVELLSRSQEALFCLPTTCYSFGSEEHLFKGIEIMRSNNAHHFYVIPDWRPTKTSSFLEWTTLGLSIGRQELLG